MTAHCNRVAGSRHTNRVGRSCDEGVRRRAYRGVQFRSKPHELDARWPEKTVARRAPDRPQPRFDLDRGNGMTVSVGRLRPCGVLDYKFTVLSHNTIRGAAGAALLNAELLKVQGYLS
jgi:aspartate-semialdehyde dehydrogenase